MGKNKQAQCKTCSKQMRADHMKRHLQVCKLASAPLSQPSKPKNQYRCSVCSLTMKKSNKARHVRTHKQRSSGDTANISDSPLQPIIQEKITSLPLAVAVVNSQSSSLSSISSLSDRPICIIREKEIG